MAVNIPEWSRILRAGVRARRDRIKALVAGGVSYGEAIRQVDYPYTTSEEFAQSHGKYIAEYELAFTQPETKNHA